MQKKLATTRRQFVLSISILAGLSVLAMGFVLYEANLIQFDDDIASEELQEAVSDFPEVQEYLETEHQNEAHFLAIANIIKNDQQESLGETMLQATIPVVFVASAVGYFVAKRLLRPVREAYEAQERFLADAAHELRNPLATMSAVVQNAESQKKKVSPASFEKYNTQLKRQLGRMVRINEDLLFLERDADYDIDQNNNVSELLHDVIEDMQPHATDKKLVFKLNIDDDVMSDIGAKEFVRMSRNVIENAIKYSKQNSKKIEIGLSESKGRPQLTVKDFGIGIAENDIQQVKERFFRGSNTSDLPGSGLGLSIVQKIVDVRGGNFEIESELNRGTTITVTF